MLCKRRPTHFIRPEEAEVTWYLPHDGGGQSLVETKGTICLQDRLHYCPCCAEVTPQNMKQLNMHQPKSKHLLLISVSLLLTLTSSVHLQFCQMPPFRAWPASDISPARWGTMPWQRRWRLKTLLMPSVHHWLAMEKKKKLCDPTQLHCSIAQQSMTKSFTSQEEDRRKNVQPRQF